MKGSFFLLLATTAYSAWANLPDPGTCGLDISDRIYGGNITGLTSYPWTAILIYREKGHDSDLFHCGGSLISDRYVLTAAHCLDDLSEDYRLDRIRLGEWNLLTDPDCDEHDYCNEPPLDVGIEEMINHEDYDKVTILNDIALVKLNQSVNFTETISPVCLPLSDQAKNKNTDEMVFTAIGWGNTEHRNGTYEYGSTHKLHVQVRGVNLTYCNEVYDDEITPTQICAGGESGKDSCQGDSGGGLVSAVDGFYYDYGVVSWGYGCGRKGTPGIYTRVTSFLDWIKNKMDE